MHSYLYLITLTQFEQIHEGQGQNGSEICITSYCTAGFGHLSEKGKYETSLHLVILVAYCAMSSLHNNTERLICGLKNDQNMSINCQKCKFFIVQKYEAMPIKAALGSSVDEWRSKVVEFSKYL